jgi:hypothetical protein
VAISYVRTYGLVSLFEWTLRVQNRFGEILCAYVKLREIPLNLQARSRELRALLIGRLRDQATSSTMQTSADVTRMRDKPPVVLLGERTTCSLSHILGPPVVDVQAHPQRRQS